MATRFQSAYTRSIWFTLGFAIVTDFALALGVAALFVTDPDTPILMPALLFMGAVYAVQLGYAIWSALRLSATFALYEKERRVQLFLDEFRSKQYPAPDDFYGAAEEYLAQVVRNRKAPDTARMSAASLVGGLDTLSHMGHPLQRMFVSIAAEEAVRRYGATLVHSALLTEDDLAE